MKYTDYTDDQVSWTKMFTDPYILLISVVQMFLWCVRVPASALAHELQ